jgi:putative aldouronate transport system substrate-binding protein
LPGEKSGGFAGQVLDRRKEMKKKTVLVLALIIALAGVGQVFAGGQGGSKAGGRAEGAQTTGWFADKGDALAKPLTIEYAEIRLESARNYNNGDPWSTQWTKDFNLTFNMVPMTQENWNERVRIWVNSGDAPEVFTYQYNHGEATDWVNQGLVKKLPAGWEKKYPNVAQMVKNSGFSDIAERDFGGTYFLFRPIFANNRPSAKISSHSSLYIRKDWAKAVGVDVPEAMKLSDIIELGRKLLKANPGNVPNFHPIAGRPEMMGNFVMWNNANTGPSGTSNGATFPYYLGDDGKYHWGPGEQSTLEALKLLNQAYNEGIIDPEFYTLKRPDDFGGFYTTGRIAIHPNEAMSGQLSTTKIYMKRDLGLEFEDAVQMVVPLGEDGYYHGFPITNFWGCVCFSPKISDEKFDRWMQMLDYSSTKEGQYRMRLGLKGVDWDYTPDGSSYRYLYTGNQTMADRYSLTGNTIVLADDFQFENPTYLSVSPITKRMYALRDSLSTNKTFAPDVDWVVQLHSSQALNLATLDYGDEYSALLLKAGDIEANWRAWVNEKMPIIQPVLNELNAAAAKK